MSSFIDTLPLSDAFTPNVLQFDFLAAPAPTGPGTLTVGAISDLDTTEEFLTLVAESLPPQDLFVTDGLQSQFVSVDVPLSLADLQTLAADSTISLTVTPSTEVSDLTGEESVTLTLDYPYVSTAFDFFSFPLQAGDTATLALEGASGLVLDLVDSVGDVLTSGVPANNLAQVINNYVASTTGVYYARVSGQGDYQLLITQDADFDTESNRQCGQPSAVGPRSHESIGGRWKFANTNKFLCIIDGQQGDTGPTGCGAVQ